MILFRKSAAIQTYLAQESIKGRNIGFVPTMGALHLGHLSLIERSRESNSITVCSIFVNPAQFNNADDFEKYPVNIAEDILALELSGCEVLYLPSVAEVYPGGSPGTEYYDLGYLETVLEGKYRPGHFQGVCKVMHRLLTTVKPDNLYLGQKDYQQCMVISKLLMLAGMNDHTRVHIKPTLREPDGLAMSSRNQRLDMRQRVKAAAIFSTLVEIKKEFLNFDFQKLKDNAKLKLESRGFRVDYVEIAYATSLHPVDTWDGKQDLVALVAAFLDEVRLIDNMLISPGS